MRFYSEEVINKLIDECVSSWEVRDKLAKLSDEECLVVDSFDVAEDECIALMFPDSLPKEDVGIIANYLQEQYPNNPVIGILSDMDVLIQNADEALAMLDGMKNKISILKDTGVSEEKKIIL